jgi:hypothetical protein
MEFYEKLQALNIQVALDFTDQGDEGQSEVILRAPVFIDSNYPWLYCHFEYEGPLSLNSLKQIEKRYQSFMATEGGSLEIVHLSRRGSGFVVKLIAPKGMK